MVTSVTGTTAATTSTTTAAQDLQKQKNQFLTLLTTQLQNQDPTAPMDTNAMTQQLVAFNGVEQQLNTNDKLQTLIDLQTKASGNGAVQSALGYMGLNVESTGSADNTPITYDGTNPVQMTYTLPSASDQAVMSIYDANGAFVTSQVIDKTSGQHSISWDGTGPLGDQLKAGEYTMKIAAADASGNKIAGITTTVKGYVTGVEQGTNGALLNIGKHTISVDSVVSATRLTNA